MAKRIGNLNVTSRVLKGGSQTSSFRKTAVDLEHRIEVESLTWLIYEIEVQGRIQGGTRILKYPGRRTLWGSGVVALPARGRAEPSKELLCNGSTGVENLFSAVRYRVFGGHGWAAWSSPADCASVTVTT